MVSRKIRTISGKVGLWVGVCFALILTACSISYKFNGASIDYTKIKTISVDVTWKGEKRKEFTQRWINEVIK